jgi:hypothetical protein
MAALPLIVFDVNETLLDLENDGARFRAHLRRKERHASLVR